MSVPELRRIEAPAGRAAVEALAQAIADAKAGDPLAPVTVLVPSSGAGLNLRRLLGSGAVRAAGSGPGVLNVRFGIAERVAELLGAPSLAAEGRRPLSAAAQAEAIRVTLAEDPGVFGPVADHPSTEAVLEGTFAELRGVDDATLDRLAARNRRSADIVRLHRATRERLAADWYDAEDQLARAVEVASGPGRTTGRSPTSAPSSCTPHAAGTGPPSNWPGPAVGPPSSSTPPWTRHRSAPAS